jgi:hypothetical protein
MPGCEPKEHSEALRGLTQGIAELEGPGVGLFHLRRGIPPRGDQRRPQDGVQGQLVAGALRRLRQRGQHLQAGRAVRNGVAVAVPPQGILRRLPPVVHGPESVPSTLEVHRQLGGDVSRPFPVGLFQLLPDLLMQPGPTPHRHPRIHHLLIQGMPEAILAGHRAVRPGRNPLGMDELSLPGERGTAGVDVFAALADSGGHSRR